MAKSSQEQIAKVVDAFVNAPTWNDSKHIVEAQRDMLLSDVAEQFFASLLEQYRNNAHATRILENHRDLLIRCQRDGIEAAFADLLQMEELQKLLNEIEQLSSLDDMPRRVTLCQNALGLVHRDTQPQIWAHLQNQLAKSLAQNPRGERADNLEQAISLYEQALEVYARQAFPEQWAATQNYLAIAYNNRIRGERAENLEQAISLYQQVLEVYTRQAFPEGWAMTQNNLGSAYCERLRGERADNLERAISHFQQAFLVYTRQDFPEGWATTQQNLASVYRARIRGERADNLEQAISHFEQALLVFTYQDFPENWARVQNNLANAYCSRIRQERAENLEQAISHYRQALQVRTRQALPHDWAITQYNLANAYRERIRSERANNLEQAISHFEQALQVHTRLAFPEYWAEALNGLANAFHERIRGERADNLEQAIALYRQVLEVYTRQGFPEGWAGTQNNLGNAFHERIRGERADNLEQAIFHLEQALQVRTRQAFPEGWAGTQYNLAIAYRDRIRGERADNLEQAIHHYQQALEVRTPLTFPQDCRDTAYWLGRLLYDEGRFSEAQHALATAHQAVEALRGEVQRNASKHALSEENADLYARLVSCCLKKGDEAAAFEYAAAGKGRAFIDLLATARLDLSAVSANDSALADDLHKARELRQQIDALLATLTGESGPTTTGLSSVIDTETQRQTSLPPEVLRAQLRTLQTQEASHWEEMAYKYPALTATQKAPILSADQACTLATDLKATLVEYYHHAEGWRAFVVTPNAVHYVPLSLIDNDLLERMANWVRWIEHRVGRNPRSYNRLSQWYDAVIMPLEAYLPQELPLILAPFGVLHVLPLAAARHPLNGHYLAEDYLLSFAPSLSALRTVWEQAHCTGRVGEVILHRLLNVAYPGRPDSDDYLPNVRSEAEAIAKHFPQVTPLYEEEATPDAVLAQSHDQDVVHFGCHGWFDAKQPEQSGLLLAGGWLTVRRIINELHLEQARLATLGACLSGRAALLRGDEHVGLLQTMLTTSVQMVVASLWKVDDAATRILFEVFYAELVTGQPPAKALKKAMRFVRERPGWEHPYYWAAFQVSGLVNGMQEPEQGKEKIPVDLRQGKE